MIGAMKPARHSVAVVVRGADGTFLAVRRPEDPDDPLAGLWGLPAITLLPGEDEPTAVVRAGRAKLGVDLVAGRKLGEMTADRGSYLLRLSDYEATIASGTPAVPQPAVPQPAVPQPAVPQPAVPQPAVPQPAVPQPGTSMTQYTECVFTGDPALLGEAAARGSLCARIFLQSQAAAEQDRIAPG
jgi:hypothetical protein